MCNAPVVRSVQLRRWLDIAAGDWIAPLPSRALFRGRRKRHDDRSMGAVRQINAEPATNARERARWIPTPVHPLFAAEKQPMRGRPRRRARRGGKSVWFRAEKAGAGMWRACEGLGHRSEPAHTRGREYWEHSSTRLASAINPGGIELLNYRSELAALARAGTQASGEAF